MRNHLCCSALVLLMVFSCGRVSALWCQSGEECMCLQCPAGQEPSKDCRQIQSPAEEVQCQLCPKGTFSDVFDTELCRPHVSCKTLGRNIATPGTATSDAVCGDCLPGFHSATSEDTSIQGSCVKTLHVRTIRAVVKGSGGAGGPVNATVVRSAEDKMAEYAVFAVVPIFCVMGLLGILICNILKKKGYRCTPEKEGGDEETATPQKDGDGFPCMSDDRNEDTIDLLVHLISEKKENAAALEELLLEYESKQTASKGSSIKFPVLSSFCSLPRLCPHHSHLHTISGLSGLEHKHGYRCTRCSQRKWPPVLIPPLDAFRDPLKPPQTLILPSLDSSIDPQKSPLLEGVCIDTHETVPNGVRESVEGSEAVQKQEGELTVLSVGRFQVAQIPEQKPVAVEIKTSSQEPQHSTFGGKHFSTSSSIRR
ncbi:tumor necrosis factor receptor superfamily member 19L [Thalassophryne amazonica]|uniref:tumor necrosis factor receptor superfamily member 19L n=1 Tax=Thalassophryne amazonica TaxID=390379 RepID=UPI001471E19A|nr:tumor necrosis factor receptor superfamily member 19L [Thalassophryne amazonica]